MNFSLQIAKAFGIPIQIHWTFGLVFAWVVYMGRSATNSFDWQIFGWTMLSVTALFSCVILHELGHALTARRYGVTTRKILLLPIGGLAILDHLPEKPVQELLVALAGPVVNLLLGILFLPLLLTIPVDSRAQLIHFILNPEGNVFLQNITALDAFLFGLVALNILVAVFNLLPAFPMDGGRILRALLSTRMKRVNATRVATYFGQFFAVLLILYGTVDFNLVTAFIGVFVFFAAASEYRAVRADSLLENHTVGEIVRRTFTKLYPKDPLEKALIPLQQGTESYFLVFDEWQNLKGILTKEDILQGTTGDSARSPVVKNFLRTSYRIVFPTDSLQSVLSIAQRNSVSVFPVFEKGKITGLVDMAMLENFIELRQKVKRS